MAKEIKIGEQKLTVTEAYAYRYDYGRGKEVLRIRVDREDHSYAEIEAMLEAPAGDIEYLEDGETVVVYKGYERDFTCSYRDGAFEAEITRTGELERRVAELEAELAAMKS